MVSNYSRINENLDAFFAKENLDENTRVIVDFAKNILERSQFSYLRNTNRNHFITTEHWASEKYKEIEKDKKSESILCKQIFYGFAWGTAGFCSGACVGDEIAKNIVNEPNTRAVGALTGSCVGAGLSSAFAVGYVKGTAEKEAEESAFEETKKEVLKSKEYSNWKDSRWKEIIPILERIFPEVYNSRINEIECGIDKTIMSRPVKMRDEYFYEYDQIEQWLSINPTSPFTRQELSLKDAVERTGVHYKDIGEKHFREEYNKYIDEIYLAYEKKLEPKNERNRVFVRFFDLSQQEVTRCVRSAMKVANIARFEKRVKVTPQEFMALKSLSETIENFRYFVETREFKKIED